MSRGFKGERQFTWKTFGICFIISIGTLCFGYPSSIIGSTLSQPSFLQYMKLIDENGVSTPNAQALIGATSGVYQAGAFFGILVGSWVMDRFGRKFCVAYCCSLGVVGGVGCTAAQNMPMFIAFRLVAGAGAWSSLTIAPIYISELAPPRLRGLFVGLTGVFLMLGYALASYVGLAFYSVQENPVAQWRGPLGLALLFPTSMLICLPFLPESPRWCLLNNQTERAREIVMNLHGKDTASQDFAKAEFHQMTKQAEFDRTLDSSWMAMFKKPSNRKRLEMVCMYSILAQSTGLLVLTNYGSVLYGSLGYGAREQLVFGCGWITVGLGSNIFGDLIVDRVGRKPLMLIGFFTSSLWISVEAAMVAQYASPVPENPNKAGIAMAIAALYLFLGMYACTIDTAGFVFYTEVFPNHLRAKGVSAAIASAALIDVAYLQAASSAFANIGWRYFLIFIILPAIAVVYVYFRVPETKSLPLEELAQIFGDEDEVMVYSEDLIISHDTHTIAVKKHGEGAITGEKIEAAESSTQLEESDL